MATVEGRASSHEDGIYDGPGGAKVRTRAYTVVSESMPLFTLSCIPTLNEKARTVAKPRDRCTVSLPNIFEQQDQKVACLADHFVKHTATEPQGSKRPSNQ